MMLVASLVIKTTLVMATALIAARLAHRSRAAVRHVLLAATFGALALIPIASLVLPAVTVVIPVRSLAATTPTLSGVAALAPVVRGPASASVRSDTTVSLGGMTAISPFVAVWLGGVVLCLLPIAAGIWQTCRLCRSGIPWRQAKSMTNTIASDLGIGRRIDVLRDDVVTGPVTYGVLRPAIVFPLDARLWRDEDVRRAITHEVEHIRRYDWLTLCIARTICAVYWFNPLVWLALRRLCLEAECACDDAVLRHSEPVGYADQLVTIAQRLARGRGRPLLAMANRGDLSARVSAILDPRQRRGRASPFVMIASALAASVLVALLGPLRTVAMAQQPVTATTGPRFEVASVKANHSGDRRTSMRVLPGGRIEATNRTLRLLIKNAYQLQDVQIAGGPDWLDDARFDISAKAEGNPTQVEIQLMLRTLLVERFKLATHTEPRELQIYSLGLVRSGGTLGPQLRASETGCLDRLPNAPPLKPSEPPPADQAPRCGFREGIGTMVARGVTLAQLAEDLTGYVSRPVLDRTGLRGTFDLTLNWTPDQVPPPGEPSTVSPSVDLNVPSIFTAVREQLGLKLESTKGPVDVLVINRAEKPMED